MRYYALEILATPLFLGCDVGNLGISKKLSGITLWDVMRGEAGGHGTRSTPISTTHGCSLVLTDLVGCVAGSGGNDSAGDPWRKSSAACCWSQRTNRTSREAGHMRTGMVEALELSMNNAHERTGYQPSSGQVCAVSGGETPGSGGRCHRYACGVRCTWYGVWPELAGSEEGNTADGSVVGPPAVVPGPPNPPKSSIFHSHLPQPAGPSRPGRNPPRRLCVTRLTEGGASLPRSIKALSRPDRRSEQLRAQSSLQRLFVSQCATDGDARLPRPIPYTDHRSTTLRDRRDGAHECTIQLSTTLRDRRDGAHNECTIQLSLTRHDHRGSVHKTTTHVPLGRRVGPLVKLPLPPSRLSHPSRAEGRCGSALAARW